MDPRASSIAALNDAVRRDPVRSGQLVLTRGVAALPDATLEQLLEALRVFDAFTEENDPHGEHDFGSIGDVADEAVFWKIDYFGDSSLTFGSEDPSDPEQTVCLLTLMLLCAQQHNNINVAAPLM